jgi:Chaperone of endosialidase
MAISFPVSPTIGDTYAVNSRIYVWSGTYWELEGSVGAVVVASNDITDGAVSTDKLAASAVTTAKIANDAVTAAKLADTSVTPGSYTNSSITVDAQGRITAASSGSLASLATLASPTFTGNVVLPSTTTIGDISATELSYLNNVSSSIQTQLDLKINKTSLPVSVSDYGAVGDGVTDNTTAFSNAAQARTGAVTFSDNNITRANSVFVTVPDGTYALSSLVDTGGREVIWVLDRGARVLNTEYLNGEILRHGQRITQAPFGNEDNATGFAVRLYPNGSNYNDAAEVLGISNESDLSIYTDRDAVAMFADVYAPAPTLTLANATYTATTVIPTSAISSANLKLLRKGMIIDTAHSPTKYSGFITDWAANGTSITVEGWYLANGTAQSASTPSGSATAYVNPFTKVWAHNANVLMDGSSHASAMTGFELGLVDNKEASTAASGGSHYVWGFDAVNLGTYKVQSFFVARGSGFVGLRVDNADTGLYYTGGTNVVDSYISNQRSALLRADGTMELGKQNTAASWYMDIHTSGNNETVNDYDARIQATGGSNTAGNATITFFATNTDTQTLRPRTDSTYSLGGAARRWTVVYADTATINTSDEREKEQIQDIDAAVLRAWGNVEYQKFKFKDAVLKKGSGARWHIGVIAQRVKEAFEAEGVDPFAYGILCYDEWDEEEEKYEDGVGIVQQFQAAGSRYGIRYEEALALECAYLRSRLP